MIGGLNPATMPVALVPNDPSRPRMYAVACCGECGTVAGSPLARVCIRKLCGLADRFSHVRSDAA